MGRSVCQIVEETIGIRQMVEEMELLDDTVAKKAKDIIFTSSDERAVLLQFISSSDMLSHSNVISLN